MNNNNVLFLVFIDNTSTYNLTELYQQKAGFKLDEPLASMMTVLEGQRWKNVRNILTPTFTSGKLKQMITIIHDAADTLLGKMEKAADEKNAFNVHE